MYIIITVYKIINDVKMISYAYDFIYDYMFISLK